MGVFGPFAAFNGGPGCCCNDVQIACGLTDDTVLGIFKDQQEQLRVLNDLESSAVRKNELYINVAGGCDTDEVVQFQAVDVDDFVPLRLGGVVPGAWH